MDRVDNRVGIFSTLPVEVLLAAGARPIDVNNVFISDPEPGRFIETALAQGLPRSVCAWTLALYGATLSLKLPRVITLGVGDCTANEGMARLLEQAGVEVIRFFFPAASQRNLPAVRGALEALCRALGTEPAEAQAVHARLKPVRELLARVDNLGWKQRRLSSREVYGALISSTDLGGGDPEAFQAGLQELVSRGEPRPSRAPGPRLGLIGVPPVISDLLEQVEAGGAEVVFHETPFDFAMIPPAEDLAQQYLRYAHPYGIHARLELIQAQARARKLDGLLIYDQTFCHHNLESAFLDRALASLPILHLEGDRPGPLGPRDRIRLESFIRTLGSAARRSQAGREQPVDRTRAIPGVTPGICLGLDLGSRFAKLALEVQGPGERRYLRMDTIGFYRKFTRRTGQGLELDLSAVIQECLGRMPELPVTAVATGYGRHVAGLANCTPVPEVHAHGAGAAFQVGRSRFILADLGGQDTKVILVDQGQVRDFTMNDRCAAGSGRYVENMARLLGVDLEEMMSSGAEPVALSNVCATFGESEVVGLVVEGVDLDRICAGVMKSVAERLLQMLARFQEEGLSLYLSGGLGASTALRRFLSLGWRGPVEALPEHAFNGALGALEMALARDSEGPGGGDGT